MVPTLPVVALGAMLALLFSPYSDSSVGLSRIDVMVAQAFCSGMYIMFVRGLYAPACQSFPPFALGQTKRSCPLAVNSASALTDTFPVAPSILLTTVCRMVGVAHRNSPVFRSSVYTMPVFPGIPVM